MFLELDVFPFLDILSYAVFFQFVLKLGVAMEVDNEGSQIDEIAVAFDLEFELLLDGSPNGLSLDSTHLSRLRDGEPNEVLIVDFSFRGGCFFGHIDKKRVIILAYFLSYFSG